MKVRKIKTSMVVGGVAALALAACCSACTDNYAKKSLPPGEYTRTESNTNTQGTTTQKKINTNVYYDEHGNKRVMEETETSRDPKGLFNKSTSTSTTTY